MRRTLGAFCVVALFFPDAFAARTDRDQPIQISADRSQTSDKTGITVLSGDVRIDQGSLSIRAERGEIEQKDGEVHRVVFEGSPVHLEQDIEGQSRLVASAARLEYLLAERTVVLTGMVRIERPRGVLTGERVVYRLDSGEMLAGEPGSRVQMTIAAKPKSAKPETEAPKP